MNQLYYLKYPAFNNNKNKRQAKNKKIEYFYGKTAINRNWLSVEPDSFSR